MVHHSRTRRAALVGSLVVMLALGLAPAPIAQAAPRDRLLTIINRVRANHDLRSLRLNVSLSEDAKRHTRRMIRAGRLFDPPNLYRLLEPYDDWDRIGGSVAGCRGSLRELVRAWMAHGEHRDILLLPALRRAGIGVIFVEEMTSCGRRQFWATGILYG